MEDSCIWIQIRLSFKYLILKKDSMTLYSRIGRDLTSKDLIIKDIHIIRSYERLRNKLKMTLEKIYQNSNMTRRPGIKKLIRFMKLKLAVVNQAYSKVN